MAVHKTVNVNFLMSTKAVKAGGHGRRQRNSHFTKENNTGFFERH